jgi:zinc and cadmium transporter
VGDLFALLAGALLMSAVAMVGGVTTLLTPSALERTLLPLVALAAGTLLGGAALHFGCFALGLALMWALGGLP